MDMKRYRPSQHQPMATAGNGGIAVFGMAITQSQGVSGLEEDPSTISIN
jgi:hypothetical protein